MTLKCCNFCNCINSHCCSIVPLKKGPKPRHCSFSKTVSTKLYNIMANSSRYMTQLALSTLFNFAVLITLLHTGQILFV